MKLFRSLLKRGWDLVLNFGRQTNRKPGFIFGLFLVSLDRLGIIGRITSGFSAQHYLSATRLNPENSTVHTPFKCELLVVATIKDFELLPISIESVIKTQTSIIFTKVNVVVPENYLSEAKSISFSNKSLISIICEDEYFKNSEIIEIEEHFKQRSGWVKQQLIKIRHISNSESVFTLVLDADTLILRNREWVDEDQRQILFQSEEFNPEYYDFLSRSGIQPSRRHSFITHYMLFNRERLLEALALVGMNQPEKQLSVLLMNSRKGVESPFSIDFELYGQYLLLNNLCVLRKWSHIDINPSLISVTSDRERCLSELSNNWASVSIHSWRNT